ncbi:MAG: hypothetical protein LBS77_06265 [Desulfovibrio sp.]|nr:hypothetical protein [Desulfovibrio sp.]
MLGVRRRFGPDEVTDTLGEQVRRTVDVLVQYLDKANEDRNRELLRDVKPTDPYEVRLTVMMRLVIFDRATKKSWDDKISVVHGKPAGRQNRIHWRVLMQRQFQA